MSGPVFDPIHYTAERALYEIQTLQGYRHMEPAAMQTLFVDIIHLHIYIL